MERTYVKDIKEGREVLLNGWVYESRDTGKLKFLVLRDYTGMVQCIIKEPKVAKIFSQLTLETVVGIKGKVKKANVKADFARKDIEVEVSDLEILNRAGKLPIQVNEKTVSTEINSRLDNRSLDVRKPKVFAIFKIQSTIINGFRKFFYKKGFTEIQPPEITATSTEGGADMFKVDYFGRDAYLAQSPQLYKQMMAISMEKVFSTSPVWRAEKHDTSKHINEIRQMDIECAFQNDIMIMKWLEQCVQYIVEKILDEREEELKVLGIDVKVPKTKYLTYKEAVETLNKHGLKMKQGDDFEPEAERKLCEIFPDTIIFTYEWPIKMKPFYIWPKDAKKGISGGFDAVYGGIEISSGGQRVHIPDILIQQIKSKGLKPEDFKWYVDAFRYGSPIHSGWSIGLERLTQAICKLNNIREGTLFPRDRRRLTP